MDTDGERSSRKRGPTGGGGSPKSLNGTAKLKKAEYAGSYRATATGDGQLRHFGGLDRACARGGGGANTGGAAHHSRRVSGRARVVAALRLHRPARRVQMVVHGVRRGFRLPSPHPFFPYSPSRPITRGLLSFRASFPRRSVPREIATPESLDSTRSLLSSGRPMEGFACGCAIIPHPCPPSLDRPRLGVVLPVRPVKTPRKSDCALSTRQNGWWLCGTRGSKKTGGPCPTWCRGAAPLLCRFPHPPQARAWGASEPASQRASSPTGLLVA